MTPRGCGRDNVPLPGRPQGSPLQYTSGWSPRYVPDSLLREAATRLQDRFLFGSDYPFITPQRWLKDFEAVQKNRKSPLRNGMQ